MSDQTWGQFLRQYRRQAEGGGLTQDKLADLLYERYEVIYTRATISDWERGKSQPHKDDRHTLLSLIKLLYAGQGIVTVAQANRWLLAGNYRPLSPTERADITPDWAVATAFVPPFMAPPLPDWPLIGREGVLGQLKETLLSAPRHSVALVGLPGVGKTSLLTALAHDPDLQAAYPDGLLWAGLGRQPDVADWLGRWAAALGIPAEEMAALEEVQAQAERLRTAIGTRRLLLITDDVWRAETAVPFRQVGGAYCTHLLTTRIPDVAYDAAEVRHLGELNPEHGLALLAQFAADIVAAEPAEAHQLVEYVGGLPLALALMGRFLRKQGRNRQPRRIRRALEQLRDAETRLTLTQAPVVSQMYTNLPHENTLSLEAAIALSDEALDVVAQGALRALAVFPPKPNSFAEEAALAVIAQEVEVLDALTDAGLLEANGERYTLHQTTADYARLRQTDPATHHQRAADYFVTLAQRHARQPQLLAAEWENLQASLHWAAQRPQGETYHALVAALTQPYLGILGVMEAGGHWREAHTHLTQLLAQSDLPRASLWTRLGVFAQRLGEATTAEHAFQQSQRLLDDLPASDEVALERAQLAAVLAQWYTRRDRPAALAWVARGLAHLEAVTGGAAHQRGYLHVIEAGLLGRLGRLAEARSAAQRGLELLPPQPTAAQVSGRMVLGTVALYTGQLTQAAKVYREGLQAAKALGDVRRQASLRENLGIVAERQGALPTALAEYGEARRIYQRVGYVAEEGGALINAGQAHYILGEETQAAEALTAAIQLAEQHRLPNLEAFAKTTLVPLQVGRGAHEAARTALGRCAAICEQLQQPFLRPFIAYWQAEIARREGELPTALAHAERAVQLAQELGDEAEAGVAWSVMGKVLTDWARWDEAEAAHRRAVDILTGGNPYPLGLAQVALGEHYLAQGRGAEAQPWLTEALALLSQLGATGAVGHIQRLLS